MSPATLKVEGRRPVLCEVRLGVVRIDGARHRLIWAHDRERSVSVLIDRPEQGGEKVDRLIGAFGPEEHADAVKALAEDYVERYVGRPLTERIRPRTVSPTDLAPAS